MPTPFQKLTPTARLILLVLDRVKRPLSSLELAIETGCFLASLKLIVPRLYRSGHVNRTTEGALSSFEFHSPSDCADFPILFADGKGLNLQT